MFDRFLSVADFNVASQDNECSFLFMNMYKMVLGSMQVEVCRFLLLNAYAKLHDFTVS